MKEQISVIAAASIGLAISFLCSEKHSLWLSLARITAGLFCVFFLVDPILHYMDLPEEHYRDGLSGLLAMGGYAFTRFLVNMDAGLIIDILKVVRGRK